MRRFYQSAATFALSLILPGCYFTYSGPLTENPVLVRPQTGTTVENPVYVPLSPQNYGAVFEKTIDVLDDYFEIAYTNRYDGRIETFPRIAPGYEQFFKPGNPNPRDRLQATFQTIRNRAVVLIQPAQDGGYFIDVSVYKELEDLPQPDRATAGAAIFQGVNSVERQFEVVDPSVFESNWIPLGRNHHLEQLILHRLRSECM
ncbi:MAG: hypothetical protein KatS3mg105_4522 [Gemmatales bacterium]|nr:MAG: hypothetical protein KatS3mg105_4522 [Gemmatales bacterium]